MAWVALHAVVVCPMESRTSFHRMPPRNNRRIAHRHTDGKPPESGLAHFAGYGVEVNPLKRIDE